MKRMLNELARELPLLGTDHVKRLWEARVRDRKDIEDVVRGVPDGGPLLAKFLEIDPQLLLKAMAWSHWPEHAGVTLSGPCPLGVLAPTADMLQSRRGRQVTLSPTRLPAYASLLGRYGPARSQGSVGTCTAFATAGSVEGQHPSVIDFSERFVYSLTKARDGHAETDGSWLRFSMPVLNEYGICREETCPYVEDRDELRQRPSQDAFDEATSFRVHSVPIELEPKDSLAIRDEIAAGHPVAISVPIFRSSMNSLRFHGEGRFLMKLGLLDKVAGYHAMCAVAYLDNDYLAEHDFPDEPGGGVLLVRNSWGPNWASSNPLSKLLGGRPGYASMPYAYVESYCFEAYTAVVSAGVRRAISRSLAAGARSVGASWWRRTRNAVVTQARERLAELKQ